MSPQIFFRINLLILIIFAANAFVFALPDGRVSLIDYLLVLIFGCAESLLLHESLQ